MPPSTWRGGGRIFPNRPDENFSRKLNRKMYRAGVCVILSQLAREGRLAVVESLAIDARHRLVLVRRDDREHLILIGTADTVVESGIAAPLPPPESIP